MKTILDGDKASQSSEEDETQLVQRIKGVLVKTTAVDYPGRIASSFFLCGCNLCCPYCQNADIVLAGGAARSPSKEESDILFSTVAQLFAHLEKRRGIINALVISGGEPLLNLATPYIIRRAHELNIAVKLDTNGTLPDKLDSIMQDKKTAPDFIAMDIKTSPTRYSKLSPASAVCKDYAPLLARSIKIISSLPPSCREWRTVLVPGLVEEDDIDAMARMLPKDASWQFAQFRPGSCIDEAYNKINPMTEEKAQHLVSLAQSKIKGSALR